MSHLNNNKSAARSKPILILFSDDSTLFFALRMRQELWIADPTKKVELAWYLPEAALSERQLKLLLPEGPNLTIEAEELASLAMSPEIEAILTSRIYKELGAVVQLTSYRRAYIRPCTVAFLGGLDFYPDKGLSTRRNCDAVYVVPYENIAKFKEITTSDRLDWQEIRFGHPAFLRPKGPPRDLKDRSDIYFFTQALSPSTRRGRVHMLRAMAAIARANPHRRVMIKLRHLPLENQTHLHRERFDYFTISRALKNMPDNLQFTACTMDDALRSAALGITCTSTAAIDLVRAGLPTMVHLDYVDNYRDRLVAPMRRIFNHSNLITPLNNMLELRAQKPSPSWVNLTFCPPDLGKQVLKTIERFKKRDLQVC